MDALTPEQQAEIKKLSSERIRAKLVKAGYDEDTVFAFDRQQLLDTFAVFTLKPVEITASDAELRGREIEARQQELKLREVEIAAQSKQRKDEIKLRMAELEAIKHQRDAELAAQQQMRDAELAAQKQQRQDEMKLRMAELEALRHQRDMEVELRKAEAVAINSGLLKSRLIILSRKRAVKLKKNKSSR